jgi:hypothetical protein
VTSSPENGRQMSADSLCWVTPEQITLLGNRGATRGRRGPDPRRAPRQITLSRSHHEQNVPPATLRKNSTASRAAIRGSGTPAAARTGCACGGRIPSCPRNPRRSR